MLPLFSVSSIREIDTRAVAEYGFPGTLLMENAAHAIIRRMHEVYPELASPKTIGIVAGKGNNGGDGFAVARLLSLAGHRLHVIALAKPPYLSAEAALNYKILENISRLNNHIFLRLYKSEKDLHSLIACDFIIDGLLGTGSNGALQKPISSIIEFINAKTGGKKIAIDVPTGVDADTGFAETAFHADLTIALAGYKTGLFIGEGLKYSGTVVTAGIGIPDEIARESNPEGYLIEPEDAFTALPVQSIDAHKYSSGKVFLIAGSAKYPGAPLLTAQGAVRTGAGAVVSALPSSLVPFAAASFPELVFDAYGSAATETLSLEHIDHLKTRLQWADAIAAGPGLGESPETLEALDAILRLPRNAPLILDASALALFENGEFKKYSLKNCVLTPHLGEFSRMMGAGTKSIVSDVLSYGKTFVKSTKAFLILKGPRTIIFTPSGEIFFNPSGNSGMAKFGMGDVLTGILAGFLSRSRSIEDALISGVYLHSLSADLLKEEKTEYGFTASEVANTLPRAITFLRKSSL